jgi:hypothetical protein
MSKSVALIYGFAEGPLHGKKFTRALQTSGYEVVNNPAEADIVITHSAGCYYVPFLHNHQRILLINPTYWPGKSRRKRAIARIRFDLLHILPTRQGPYFLHKTMWNLFYAVTDSARNRDIIHRSGRYLLQASLDHHRTAIVRNTADPWLTPDVEHLRKAHPKVQIFHVPGDHDDCWLHPERYISLLQSL